jgi:hypothetical protein
VVLDLPHLCKLPLTQPADHGVVPQLLRLLQHPHGRGAGRGAATVSPARCVGGGGGGHGRPMRGGARAARAAGRCAARRAFDQLLPALALVTGRRHAPQSSGSLYARSSPSSSWLCRSILRRVLLFSRPAAVAQKAVSLVFDNMYEAVDNDVEPIQAATLVFVDL